MAMEPQTGEIKAWVGGINYKYFQYDHVGQGARQVGSTFKPLYTPCYRTIEHVSM
jgi:penicillin-binding protein 1A